MEHELSLSGWLSCDHQCGKIEKENILFQRFPPPPRQPFRYNDECFRFSNEKALLVAENLIKFSENFLFAARTLRFLRRENDFPLLNEKLLIAFMPDLPPSVESISVRKIPFISISSSSGFDSAAPKISASSGHRARAALISSTARS